MAASESVADMGVTDLSSRDEASALADARVKVEAWQREQVNDDEVAVRCDTAASAFRSLHAMQRVRAHTHAHYVSGERRAFVT